MRSHLAPLLGVLAVSLCWSVGGPLAWFATQTLSPEEATFGRCFFAFLGLSPFLFFDGKKIIKKLNSKGRFLLIASGLTLGLHFFLFVSGVAYASLSTAVTLVAVEPALVLLVGVVGFKERLLLLGGFGILLCIGGIGVISILPHFLTYAAAEAAPAPHRAYGDMCSVFAVVLYGVYYTLNRAFRSYENSLDQEMSVLRRGFGLASIIYVFAALSSGAVLLALKSETVPFTFLTGRTFMALVAMGLIPTVLGHTISQIVSRKAHPIWVSLMSPGETLITLLLGYIFFDQRMGVFEVVGGFFILFGVLMSVYSEAKAKPIP